MSVSDKGTIRFWLQDRHPRWASDECGYDFGTKRTQGLVVTALKHPDKTVEIILDGLDGLPSRLREAIPSCDVRGLHVGITWSKTEIVLYLNGTARKTLSRSSSQGTDPTSAAVTG